MWEKAKAFVGRNLKILRWVVSLSVLFVVARRIDWGLVIGQTASANAILVTAGIIGFGIYWALGVWRWQILLNAFGICYPFPKAFELYCIGLFAGFLLSDSIGGFARGFYVRKEGYSVGRAMLTILFDKTMELTGLLVFGLVGFAVFSSALELTWLVWLVPTALALFVGSAWYFRGRLRFWIGQRLDNWMGNRFHVTSQTPVSRLIDELSLISTQVWLQAVLVTIACRLAHYWAVFALARSLGSSISFLAIVAVMSLVGVAVVLPISVAGGIGIREGTLVALLALLGQGREFALALSLLIFLCSVAWRMGGMILWFRNPLPKPSPS
jgi:uncharacterized protein (TIRG00374 family)